MKINLFRAFFILGGGGLVIYLAIKLGESNIGWLIP